jgi:alanine racemase
MRLALLPVGYADGLRRGLSSTNEEPGGWVMIGGEKAPILGRISMNLTTVDVTGINCHPGTPVTLLGPGITAEDHARLANCLPYEVLCGLKASHRTAS